MKGLLPPALCAATALAIPLATRDAYLIQLLNIATLNAIVVLGLNFATGWTGQIRAVAGSVKSFTVFARARL